ncbi:MAG TPA: hypothetical protein VK623_00050 [Flavobacterium sp.]|nr:hypothetical protein [Flavobacterium sp.]
MNYLKFTPYIYLIAAFFFIYDGITKMNEPESGYALSFLIAGLAVFMFFFRMRFAKKFDNGSKRP